MAVRGEAVLEVAKQVVRATVEARFRISEPDLAGTGEPAAGPT